jgi:predicted peptidase
VHGAKLFLTDENRKQYRGIIIFPQCPSENSWSTVKVDNTKTPREFSFDYTRTSNWPLVSAIELIKRTIGEGSVDKKRVYIAGLSMGGMGTFEAAYFNPKLFAAAMPICGGGDAAHYDKRVKKIPFWVFHGAVDAVVDVKYSRQMVERLKQLKADVRYTEYPEVNHNSWDNAFAEPDFMKWMFDHKK